MKLFALVAAVSASTKWDGISVDNTCGQQISGENFVNKTCNIAGSDIKSVFAGNGAFITGPASFTGFDGISGEVDAVVFFNQALDDDGVLSNTTCWDVDIDCQDNGAAVEGVFFMETVNDDRQAKGANYNLQIVGVKPGDVLAINLNDGDLNGYACQNISAPFGSVTATDDVWGNQYSDSGSFSVTVDDVEFGELFQISITQQPGQTSALNLWQSSVSN